MELVRPHPIMSKSVRLLSTYDITVPEIFSNIDKYRKADSVTVQFMQ